MCICALCIVKFQISLLQCSEQATISQKIQAPALTKDMQTPLPLRSGHLDIKDAQCAENKDVCKISYHIISRWVAAGVQKGAFWAPKNSFVFKNGQISGQIGNYFFVRFLVFEI